MFFEVDKPFKGVALTLTDIYIRFSHVISILLKKNKKQKKGPCHEVRSRKCKRFLSKVNIVRISFQCVYFIYFF